MKSTGFRKVESEADIIAAFLGEAEASSVSKLSDPTKLQTDASASQGSRTLCVARLANEILEIVAKRFPDDEILSGLISFYKKLDELFGSYSSRIVRQSWRREDYENFDREINLVRSQLAQFGDEHTEEIMRLQEQFLAIQKEVLGVSSDRLVFTPQFSFLVYTREQNGHLPGEIRERGGRAMRRGSFVAVDVDERIRFHKIPLILGLNSGMQILAASPDYLFELQNVRLKTEWTEDQYTGQPRLKLKTLPAQPYDDAVLRVQELTKYLAERNAEKEKYQDENEHPEIINVEREKAVGRDHSCFGMAPHHPNLDWDKLDQEVMQPGLTETEVLAKVIAWWPKDLEIINQMEVLLGKNRGDAEDRGKQKIQVQRLGRRGGKPGGLGFPGGGVESDDWSRVTDQNLKRILVPVLYEKTQKDPFFHKMITNLLREFYNETGHWPLRVYARIARIPKGESHVTHFWLIRAERSASGSVRELNEMDLNQVKEWYSFLELFQNKIGGLDVQNRNQRKDLPYCSHLRIPVQFFEKSGIPLTDGMKNFQQRLKR